MSMKLSIQKWGNSAAVRLPTAMLAQLGVKVGDELNADVSDGTLTLQPARPKYNIAALMAEMPDGLPRVEGWDSVPAVGKELG